MAQELTSPQIIVYLRPETMSMIYITRKEHFSAAHKLFREEWSDEKNFQIFGKCANPNWHGHNYHLFVTVKGEPDPETGFLANLRTISDVMRETITKKIDHKNANLDVEFLKGIIPTTENIAIAIWNELKPHIEQLNCKLHCVKLQETDNNYVEYFGN
jgi:6-pyruvoyltetrahydropterin/6-carboxytetrahydropterin synthase